jgi:glycosyltransferase involved in cell wall biosynthesis
VTAPVGNWKPDLVKVRIVHETNPKKYFPALLQLAAAGSIDLVGMHRYSVFKEWLRASRRERQGLRVRNLKAFSDLKFRLRMSFLRNETIVVGFAPWDWRVIFYVPLLRRNRIVYHTSWPDWEVRRTPRQYGLLTPLLMRLWIYVLTHRNVRVVSVLKEGANDLATRYGIESAVIPHAVSDSFYSKETVDVALVAQPLRLLYVGELSIKKGLERIFSIVERLPMEIELTIVGDGPLRERCEAAAGNKNVRFLGPIEDREMLAREMASQDVLLLLSIRQGTWQELFGIVLAEAIASGLGVIASNHIGPVAVCGSRQLGNLFDDTDDDGPYDLLSQLSSDLVFRRKFRESHRGLAAPFHVDKIARDWLDLLETDR